MKKLLIVPALVLSLSGCGTGTGDIVSQFSDAMVTTCKFLPTPDSAAALVAAFNLQTDTSGTAAIVAAAAAACPLILAQMGEPQGPAAAGEAKSISIMVNGKKVEVSGSFVK